MWPAIFWGNSESASRLLATLFFRVERERKRRGVLHFASLRRQISMNCLMSDTSRGMAGDVEGENREQEEEEVMLSLALRWFSRWELLVRDLSEEPLL